MRTKSTPGIARTVVSWAALGALVAHLLGAGACVPPESDAPPLRQAVTRSDHDAHYFPTDHGREENPKRDCNVCHGAFDSFRDFDCLPCHTHDKAWSDEHHSRIAGYESSSRACLDCHPMGQSAEIEHERLFPIAAGAHSQLDCEACHTLLPADYLPMSCKDCHEHSAPVAEPQHEKVDSYRWETEGCLQCHPRGESPGQGHDERFPIRAGAHAGLLCLDCHPQATAQRAYEPLTCVGCHNHGETLMNERHGGLAGYRWATEACLECHPKGEPASVDHSQFFPIGAGSTHPDALCRDCHPDSLGTASCVGCHEHRQDLMDDEHALKPEYGYSSPECLRCHPDGQVMTVTRHSPFFPVRTGRHARYTCAQCHRDPDTYMTFHCIECHTGEHSCARMDAQHRRNSRYACENTRCYDCHPRGVEDD